MREFLDPVNAAAHTLSSFTFRLLGHLQVRRSTRQPCRDRCTCRGIDKPLSNAGPLAVTFRGEVHIDRCEQAQERQKGEPLLFAQIVDYSFQ